MAKKVVVTNTPASGPKTNPVVIVIIGVIIVGALYYGANRWRQQQYLNQLAKMYGGNAGLLGGLTGGGGGQLNQEMLKKIAEESAKEEARQKEEDAKEAAKTPLDRFNETKAVTLTGNTSSIIKETVESPLTTVFGKIKPTLSSGNYMGQGNSYLAVFKIPRVPTSEDMNKLVEELTKSGYTAGMSTIEAEAANILMEKNGNTVSVYYDDPVKQEIGVLYAEQNTGN